MTTTYDEVAYPARFHPEAHPDRLATMGRLFGLEAPPLDGCRVLELGCGAGGNLIPAAYSLPTATFVGVELSEMAAGAAGAAARDLGLTGVSVRAMDLRDFPADAGTFDYVIAHGVYSWVPADVRERLLAICHDHLAENGVAYVSFNAYPGHRLREIARDLMRFGRTRRGAEEAPECVRRSRDLLGAIADGASGDEVYDGVIRAERARVGEIDDRVFFHDDLAEINTPFYFHEFAADVGRHALQYLADAEYAETADRPIRPGQADRLVKLAGNDLIAREQYADFLTGRAFRRALLCHAGARLERPAPPTRLRGLRLAANVRPTDSPGARAAGGVRRFDTPKGVTLSTNHPQAGAALEYLGDRWPGSVAFEDLLAAVGAADSSAHADELGGFLLRAAAGGVVQLSVRQPQWEPKPGEFPRASRLARWQARRGDLVTTLTGASVKLEGPLARELLILLDGTRDRAAIVEGLAEGVVAGRIPLSASASIVDPVQVRDLLRSGLEARLQQLAGLGLFERGK
jgi:methyltransferase-like protein